MKIHLFKNNADISIGIHYSKDLFVDGEHVLTFSIWHWDIEMEWYR